MVDIKRKQNDSQLFSQVFSASKVFDSIKGKKISDELIYPTAVQVLYSLYFMSCLKNYDIETSTVRKINETRTGFIISALMLF